ncbi:MAG: polyprenyl synthetase family protein [Kiritimatiellae bacterium]|nr:polyprenyl synthetase family protein [Kiritimatiellia bacterium]
MFDLPSYLSVRRMQVDDYLDRHLPAASTRPAVLHEAMRYSIFGEAKRIRPILCMAAAEAVGGAATSALRPGAAVELLHTYTLVHDDLPAMDDDLLRRGRPTCHVKFGEANAILAGDALLTMAFEWLADCIAPMPHAPTALIAELARATGSSGVIAGQVEDLAAEGRASDAELVDYIHFHKTADLLRAALRMGAIAGGGTSAHIEALSEYGNRIGVAFQIADDLLNATSHRDALGKNTGTDAKRGKLTYVAVHGIDESRRRAQTLVAEAKENLQTLPGNITPLAAIADFVAARKF